MNIAGGEEEIIDSAKNVLFLSADVTDAESRSSGAGCKPKQWKIIYFNKTVRKSIYFNSQFEKIIIGQLQKYKKNVFISIDNIFFETSKNKMK